MSETKVGKIQVLGNLGQGAHSTILHVRRDSDRKEYALKVVPIDGPDDQKFLEQAKHEHRVAAMLDHPNLVKVPAIECEKDWLFRVKKVTLLVEYVDGKTLDRLIGLPVKRLLPVFVQVASGLVHMHRRGVFHADLKPNNVMLSKTGRAKVIDYGLAWIKGEPKDRIQGTPEYMAPETLKHSLVNERTDVYNFGATMYRMTTGELPPAATAVAGGGLGTLGWEKLYVPVCKAKPNVPAALGELIDRCLAYKAHGRPERMSEVQGELDKLAEEYGEPAE